jgi:hypothetical protein
MVTLMSKGPGRVQRAISAAFAAEPDNAFLLSELCERVYPGLNRIDKKHRNAVARAAKAIPSIDYMKREVLGSELVFYDQFNVMSYAMARLKADHLHRYRNNDNRYFTPRGWFRDAMGFKKGYSYQWKGESEAELRALIAEGGKEHKLVVEGGAWWLHTELAKAKARGDRKRTAQIQKHLDRNRGKLAKSIHTLARKVSEQKAP